MLNIFCITLPCAMCLVFALLFGLRDNKSATDRIFLALSLCAGVYFFAELNYISQVEDYRTWVLADILSQYARPLVPPLMVLCLHSMMNRLVWRWWVFVAFAIAIMIGSVSMCVYFIMGLDNAANYVDAVDAGDGIAEGYKERIYELHQLFCVWLYRATTVIYVLIGIARIGYLFYRTRFRLCEIRDFLLHGGEIEPAHLEGMLCLVMLASILVKLYIGKYFFMDNQMCASVFCLFRSALIFCMGYVGLRNSEPTLSLSSLRYSHVESAEKNEKPTEVVTVSYADMADEECAHVERFAEIEAKRLFLESGLTIEMCSSMIGTNRTYLSKYINERFGCSYKEYMNGLRIEYSKSYMLAHPDDKQEVVAEACGFADAPSYNKKFKAMVGKSPRMWMMMQG